MNTYRFAGLAAGLVAGIMIASFADIQLPLVVLALLCIAGAGATIAGRIAEARWIAWPRTLILLAALAFSLPIGYYRTRQVLTPTDPASLQSRLALQSPGVRLSFQGIIATEPEWRETGDVDVTIRVTALRPAAEPNSPWLPVSQGRLLVRVFAYRTNRPETIDRLHALALPQAYGDLVEVSASYAPIQPPNNPHDFDYAAFLRQSGIEASVRCHIAHFKTLDVAMGNPLMALALQAKTSFLETFKRTIPAPASRIAAAATLGARRAVEDVDFRGMDISEMFRHAGVGHVLAVSGLHVSVIAVLLFALFRMTGSSPRIFVPPLVFFLLLFALLTGARPSSVRAVVMNSVILFSIAYFRCNLRAATTIGLCASAFAILLKNPLLLTAPSFLLSYGAVLSLVALAPPLDRFLCTLRGASSLFFLLWLAIIMVIAGLNFTWLTGPLHIISLAAILGLLLHTGTRINHAYPRLWNYGFARVPQVLRMFLAAQLAIQIGMMFPLSAWYFGRFPVAGILVNLAAIPIIGILVQLGMLLGLIGLIPLIGSILAIPFGAATGLVGHTFLLLAYAGATWFPFPATPKPSIIQLAIYYAVVAGVLLAEQNRYLILDHIYRYATRKNKLRHHGILVPAMLVVLILMPWIFRPYGPSRATHMQILSSNRFPIITLHGKTRTDIINAGDALTGERLLFDHIRAKGNVSIASAYLPSPDPAAGIEGIVALATIVPVKAAQLALIPPKNLNFTDAIGDDYLSNAAQQGARWAVRYDSAFNALQGSVVSNQNPQALLRLDDTEKTREWENVQITHFSPFEGEVSRFAASARTPILKAQINGLPWVIITDATPESIDATLASKPACSILVVSDMSTRANYFRWLQPAVETLRPEVLIIAGKNPITWSNLRQKWLANLEAEGMHIIQLAIDGAVDGQLRTDGKTILQTFRTKRKIQLPK